METTQKSSAVKRFVSQRGMGQVITVTVGLIILCIVFGIINPMFFYIQKYSKPA